MHTNYPELAVIDSTVATVAPYLSHKLSQCRIVNVYDPYIQTRIHAHISTYTTWLGLMSFPIATSVTSLVFHPIKFVLLAVPCS
jgi:hypothetical protein